MNTKTNQASLTNNVAASSAEDQAARAKYLVQRANRQRYSFGPVWNKAVLEGKVSDHDKLIAQAVKLKVAQRYAAKKLRFETLLAKVQNALSNSSSNANA